MKPARFAYHAPESVTEALQDQLDRLNLRHPPALTVRVNTRSR